MNRDDNQDRESTQSVQPRDPLLPWVRIRNCHSQFAACLSRLPLGNRPPHRKPNPEFQLSRAPENFGTEARRRLSRNRQNLDTAQLPPRRNRRFSSRCHFVWLEGEGTERW